MKKTLCIGALFVLVTVTAACSMKIFEDVGSDPHPPTFEVTALVVYSATEETTEEETPAADKAGSSTRGRSITFDSGGLTLTAGEKFQIGLVYTDAGGDILQFHIRDRDGMFLVDLVPVDLTYFSGTMGAVFGPDGGLELTGIFGPHRLEIWAIDSHSSRSEKVEFTITLADPI